MSLDDIIKLLIQLSPRDNEQTTTEIEYCFCYEHELGREIIFTLQNSCFIFGQPISLQYILVPIGRCSLLHICILQIDKI